MKIRIEVESGISEPELIVRYSSVDENIMNLQKYISGFDKGKIIFYKDDTEYYFPVGNILFFETTSGDVAAHTRDDIFFVKLKLYELEQLLPAQFIRTSKSGIINTEQVYSVTKNITGASRVEFKDSRKVMYVSRSYFRLLRERLITNALRDI